MTYQNLLARQALKKKPTLPDAQSIIAEHGSHAGETSLPPLDSSPQAQEKKRERISPMSPLPVAPSSNSAALNSQEKPPIKFPHPQTPDRLQKRGEQVGTALAAQGKWRQYLASHKKPPLISHQSPLHHVVRLPSNTPAFTYPVSQYGGFPVNQTGGYAPSLHFSRFMPGMGPTTVVRGMVGMGYPMLGAYLSVRHALLDVLSCE